VYQANVYQTMYQAIVEREASDCGKLGTRMQVIVERVHVKTDVKSMQICQSEMTRVAV